MGGYINGTKSSGSVVYGTATIPATELYVEVTHGIGKTPNWLNVESLDVYGINKYADTIGATIFRINLKDAQPVAAEFMWSGGNK